MTTERYWIFRANYLRLEAGSLRRRAAIMVQEAERIEALAQDAESIGVNSALDKLDDAIRANHQ